MGIETALTAREHRGPFTCTMLLFLKHEHAHIITRRPGERISLLTQLVHYRYVDGVSHFPKVTNGECPSDREPTFIPVNVVWGSTPGSGVQAAD